MTRRLRLVLALAAAALLAGLVMAACTDRNAPEPAYLDGLHGWSATRLRQEHDALRAEEEALAVRLAETRDGDLPPTARAAAVRSLEDSLAAAQAKRRAVAQALAAGQYGRSELRYPVRTITLPAPGEPAPQATDPAPGADAPAPGGTGTTPAPPAPAANAASGQPSPAGTAPAQAAAEAPSPVPTPATPPAAAARPAAAGSGQAAVARVLKVETARTGAGLEVRVLLEGRPESRLFTLSGPPRIVLDISGVAEPDFRLFNRTLGAVEAQGLRLGWHGEAGFLRLVLDTDPAHLGRAALERTADGLVLRVAP